MDALLNLNKEISVGQKSSGASQTNDYTVKADQVWSMLDDMAASSPDAYKQFIEKTLKEGKEAMKPPEAHMCIKTSVLLPGAEKKLLFINFFSWQRIPAPPSEDDPISVYGPDIYTERNVAVANLAFNPIVLEKYGIACANTNREQDMLIALAFDFLEQQNTGAKITERSGYKIVSGVKCHGDLNECVARLIKRQHSAEQTSDLELAKEAFRSIQGEDANIPDSVLSKLANMGISTEQSKNKPENKSSIKPKILVEEVPEELETPKYDQEIVTIESNRTMLQLNIYLPKITSMSQCSLDFSHPYLTLGFKGKSYKDLNVSLADQQGVEPNKIEAKFIKKTSVLRIKIPIANKSE